MLSSVFKKISSKALGTNTCAKTLRYEYCMLISLEGNYTHQSLDVKSLVGIKTCSLAITVSARLKFAAIKTAPTSSPEVDSPWNYGRKIRHHKPQGFTRGRFAMKLREKNTSPQAARGFGDQPDEDHETFLKGFGTWWRSCDNFIALSLFLKGWSHGTESLNVLIWYV